VFVAEDEDAAAIGLFEDEAETAGLFIAVGNEVAFLGKKIDEEIGQGGQIFEGGGFDTDIIGHEVDAP